MKLLLAYGADPNICDDEAAGEQPVPTGRRRAAAMRAVTGPDVPPVPTGGPDIPPLVAAAGAGYGEGFAANAHRFAPTGMLAAVKFLVEELHADVNAQDADGNTALHNAASRGDNEMIQYLVSKGADVKAVNRAGADDRRHGERSGSAHAAVPGDDQVARRPRREKQSPLRFLLDEFAGFGESTSFSESAPLSAMVHLFSDSAPASAMVRQTSPIVRRLRRWCWSARLQPSDLSRKSSTILTNSPDRVQMRAWSASSTMTSSEPAMPA